MIKDAVLHLSDALMEFKPHTVAHRVGSWLKKMFT